MVTALFLLSVIGGFVSGLLGVGGAVILIPMMLAVPPLLGVGELDMKQVAGISIIQVLAASASGYLSHRKGGFADNRVLLAMGLPMGLCSLAGGYCSDFVEGEVLLVIFGVLVVVAFLILVTRKPRPESEQTIKATLEFNLPLSVVIGAAVGFAAGMIGAGGGFILIPLMIAALNIPVRVAVGSSLGIVFIGAIMGSVGKLISFQIEWLYVLPALLGAIPASRLGAYVSKSISAASLKALLVVLVFLTLIKTWWDIFEEVLLDSV